MDDRTEHETAAVRLLYDDEAPRLRRPINPTILQFRRPLFFFAPLALLLSAGLPALAAGVLLSEALPWTREVVAAGLGSFLALIIFFALVLARREERSFSLLVPNTLSAAHGFLALCFLGAFILAGPLGRAEVPQIFALLPGPPVDELPLQFAKAYIFFFLVVTVTSILAILLMRFVGLRRVIAEAD